MIKSKTFNGIFDEHIKKYPDSRRVTEYMARQKAEAIKWINNCEWNGKSITCCTKENRCIACRRFIKFFNIDEEDLNDNNL